MTRRAALLAMLLAAAALNRAHAQSTPDPIGALLGAPPAASPADEEPDVAAEGRPVEPDPADGLPQAPQPYRGVAPPLTAPVAVEETGKSPDAPLGPGDVAYENRIRASIAAAQRFQGAMDGGWVLSVGGVQAYDLQIVDKGDGVLEAAWRDLRRPGGLSASGFVDRLESQGPDLTLGFSAGPRSVEVRLQAAYDGVWRGEASENGRRAPAQLSRRRP